MKKAPAVLLFLLVVLAGCADLRMQPEGDDLPERVPLRIQEIISNECKLCHNPASDIVLRGQKPYFADSTEGDLNIEVIIQVSKRIALRVNEETMPRNSSDPFGESSAVFRPLNEQNKSLLVRWAGSLSPIDIIPPRVLSAEALDSVRVRLVFSEPVDRATTGNPNNYLIQLEDQQNLFLKVLAAQITGEQSVELTTAEQTGAQKYVVVVKQVKDTTGNIIVEGAGNNMLPFGGFGASVPVIVINEVLYDPPGKDAGNQLIELKNTGTASGGIGGWWICYRFEYYEIPTGVSIEPNAFLVIHLGATGDNTATAVYIQFASALDTTSSDLGLYLDSNFASPSSMVDFVQWGGSGNGREFEAVIAGIWQEGDFVPDIQEGHSIAYDGSGNTSADWCDDSTPTLGMENDCP